MDGLHVANLHFWNDTIILNQGKSGVYSQVIRYPKITNTDMSYLATPDRRTDVWSRPSCIYTQIFRPKKTGSSPIKKYFSKHLIFVYLYFMHLFSVDPKIFLKKF